MARGQHPPEVDYEKAAQWPEARKWLLENAPEWVAEAVQHMHYNLVASVKKYRDSNAQSQHIIASERAQKKKLQRHLNAIPFVDDED